MSLHNGIDTVSIVSVGIFSKTYGSTSPGNIANLYVTLGLLEDAPVSSGDVGGWLRFINIWGWPWRKIFKLWA